MKLKDSSDITKLLYNKTILDSDSQPSELLFFVKDTHYDGELDNKLSLIIVVKHSGYVVNNNFKFNSIEISDKKITIYRMEDNKRKESYYWFK